VGVGLRRKSVSQWGREECSYPIHTVLLMVHILQRSQVKCKEVTRLSYSSQEVEWNPCVSLAQAPHMPGTWQELQSHC
jgi:hypothetical protein